MGSSLIYFTAPKVLSPLQSNLNRAQHFNRSEASFTAPKVLSPLQSNLNRAAGTLTEA